EQTVDPVAIEVEVPTGYWERDAAHWPEPVSPSFRFILPLMNRLVRVAMDEAGMLFEELRLQEVGGWTYMGIVPLGGKDRKPPPAWLSRMLMPVMFRVMPKLRKRVRSSQRFLASDRCGQYIELWHREWRADAAARIKEFRTVDLKALNDDDLDGQVAARIDFAEQGWLRHFRLQFPDHLPPAELVFFCQDELGLGENHALQMLSGLSAKTTEPGHKLAELAALAQRSSNLRRMLEDATYATGTLRAADPGFAVAFETYQREYGCRSLRMEPAEKTVAECPELVLGLIRDQLARRYDPEAEGRLQHDRREAALARARELLVGRDPVLAAHFEHLVKRAQRAYPVREDNEFYLVSAPTALYRYVLLEIGRRLLDRCQVSNAHDVFFLEMEEARAALGLGGDQRALIKRRQGELAWVKAHPGPSAYGQKPGEPPPLDGLPPAARLLTKTLLWMFEGNVAPVASAQRHDQRARHLAGVAGSPGRYRGPARVILGEAQFGKIRAGDVVVCSSPSPVWSVIFPSAGALITDAGGILAHAALIAREYGVPAVLATGNGTRVLRDGQVVTVDGTAGTVVIEG
nr:PEP-utilizing enzyme [Candidatus Dormibacteraeota bacterium]